MEERICEKDVLSLEWKVEAVIGDESEGGEWWLWWGDVQDEVNQEDSEQNEVDV